MNYLQAGSKSVWLLMLVLSACATQPQQAVEPPAKSACACPPVEEAPPIQIPDVERFVPPSEPGMAGELVRTREYQLLQPAGWESLEGMERDNLATVWGGWLQSCNVLRKQDVWKAACEAAAQLSGPGSGEVRAYLRQYFSPYQVINPDGTGTGLITGYYEPLLRGSRKKTDRYRYALYSRPDDMITVDLGSVYPELASRRLRGRVQENRLSPYFSRGEIEIAQSPLAGKELLWVDDIIDLFFLQIQGSGMVRLDNGEQIHVGYADQNGHPYQSIGKLLIDRGELTADKASMQSIKDWARRNLDKLRDLLNSNPSYVFFRELPNGLPGPLGAMGVPIAAERSIAVDPRYIPLGAPVFLSTTYPNNSKPLQRLMLAQDTGGAIKGAVRADFFWGAGNEAGRQAGAMKQQGKMWVLLPKDFPLTSNGK
ncbi:MAG: murein transglycosylase [Methylophilales bacterium RIFCSPHIGHO2_02_FULL_57_10]|nr:MAG: murein transglycosylase [Methylophilales bacterium RIFCSPHIGHO2_02_FULL_57_10]